MRAISNHTQRGIRPSVLARTGQRQGAAHHATMPHYAAALYRPGCVQLDRRCAINSPPGARAELVVVTTWHRMIPRPRRGRAPGATISENVGSHAITSPSPQRWRPT